MGLHSKFNTIPSYYRNTKEFRTSNKASRLIEYLAQTAALHDKSIMANVCIVVLDTISRIYPIIRLFATARHGDGDGDDDAENHEHNSGNDQSHLNV